MHCQKLRSMNSETKKTLFPILCLMFSTSLFAQGDAARVSAKLGDGFTIATSDQKFSLNIKSNMALSTGFDLDDDGEITNSNFNIGKARLNLTGNLYGPKLTYSLQFGFAPADTKLLPNGNSAIVRDAVIHFKPNSHWQISFGQTKVKANRAQITSSQLLAFTGRTIVNDQFHQDRDFGLFTEYSQSFMAAKASITSGEGRDYGPTKDSGLNYTGRLEFYPLGKFTNKGEFSEPDLEHEISPKLMVAGAFTHNDRALRLQGTRGSLASDGTHNLNQYYADLAFKYQGFALQADFMGRNTSRPLIEGGQTIFKGYGYDAQASYNFPSRKWTIAARYASLNPHKDIQAAVNYKHQQQVTAALTYHIVGHKLKAQLEASLYNRKQIVENPYTRWSFGAVLEVGI